ncbi:hypothetical protein Droror1_Dr00013241 [Drosera rotundifolia]
MGKGDRLTGKGEVMMGGDGEVMMGDGGGWATTTRSRVEEEEDERRECERRTCLGSLTRDDVRGGLWISARGDLLGGLGSSAMDEVLGNLGRSARGDMLGGLRSSAKGRSSARDIPARSIIFWTQCGSSSAELLATFCDNILKKGGNEKLSDEAIEETLEKVVKLLTYISDKDLFAEFYRKKLARRLLFGQSASEDHERSILSKLKQQCGGQFTSKMKRMVTDMTLAKDNQSSFEEYLTSNPHTSAGLDLTVNVLTTGFWPTYKSSDLRLPEEMVKCVEVFKEYYQTKTKHRKLTWIYSLGMCNVNGKFDAKTVEMIVTTYQAAVLLLFNSSDRWSYADIVQHSNLSDEDVFRILHSLSCAKYKILNKEPATKTISPTDVFEFNHKFTDKMRRIKIPLPPLDEKKKVIEDVDKDRRYAIDASIVRIMKSRKVLNHQQLISECVEQLSRNFKPDFKVIKKRIGDLVTRDYLERDKENPNVFKYFA